MEPESSLPHSQMPAISTILSQSMQSMFLLLGAVNYSKHIFDIINTEMYFFVNKFSLKMVVMDLNM
jgi:hypothetical protein